MSSRALRKAQRERDEQEKLQKLQQGDQDGEEDDDEAEVAIQPAKMSAFAMLGEAEDEDEDEEDGGAALDGSNEESDSEQPAVVAPSTASSKKKKKKKKKAKGGGETPAQEVQDLDEIDKALKQLSTSGNAAQAGTTAAGINATVDEASRLLAIDTNHLHARNEMRRLFGRAVLEQQDDDEPPPNAAAAGGNRRLQRRMQQGGLAGALRGQGGAGDRSGRLAAMALRRNIFIQGKEEWPVATGGGLAMEVEERRADGTILYRYTHNTAYQDVERQYDICVESMDPNRLVALLQHNPYHISTLLQVSEIAKQESDHATSGDLLERALFSFGRAVHSTFAKNLSEGKARLDFARPENREFWLASWRYMQNLSMRATWRTVYEWAKLLLSLSPQEDPYALWLVLDQYALRSRQDLDFLNISRNHAFKAVHHNMPSVQFSQALAEHRAGNKSKGKQALFTAIGRHPWLAARLMQELTLQPPPAIWGKEPRTEREKLYTELYATRAKDLWNTPENASLLTEIASALPTDTAPANPDTADISLSEARHVLLSDTPALIALLPRKFTARMTSASDPVPPDESRTSYRTTRSAVAAGNAAGGLSSPAENLRELQGLYGFFANLFPWFNPTGRDGEGDGAAREDEGPDGDGDVGDAAVAAAAVGAAEGANARPSPEEIERRIRESGVSEEVILERTQRMVVLQQRLMGAGTEEVEGEDEEEEAGDVGRE